MDETKGYYKIITRPKPNAVPPDGVNKLAYYDDDWETVKEFVHYTEEELKYLEEEKKQQDIPARLDNVEKVQEELVLYLADMIGGATDAN